MNYQLRSAKNKSLSITEQIFENRGIKKEDIYHYLHTTEDDVLSPSLLAHIRDGAAMLIKHVNAGDKVFVQIDSDCDGYTSAAILINYLNRLFPHFTQNNVSYRVQDGKIHGIVEDFIPNDVKLVIAPDSSSNIYDIHQHLKQKGIDVLVLDHHEAEKVSDNACVINNQLCEYPTKSLSGAGIVYKFCQYIDELLNQDIANDYLDLVAVGIVGDMMDLHDLETKYLVSEGLRNIRNPHIKARCANNEFSIGNELTPFGISFYVAPFINAINRSGTFEEKTLVFESMLEFKAYDQIPSIKRGCKGQMETRVEQAIRTSNNVKNRQTKAEETSSEIIENLIQEQKALENKILMIFIPADQEIDVNLTGLVANQMANKYMRPTLVLNEREIDGEVHWAGSARNFANSPLLHFRQFVLESNLVDLAQGHESAFGFDIKESNVDAFIAYTNQALAAINFVANYIVDFEFKGYQVADLYDAAFDIGNLKRHWGQGIEEPLILIKDLKICKSNLILYEKGPTLKISLEHPDGNKVLDFMKFRSSQEEYESLCKDYGVVTVNIIGTCDINTWQGNSRPQIIIKDYEIIDFQDYYF